MRKGDKIFIREDRPGKGCFKTSVYDLIPGLVFVNDEDVVDMYTELLEFRKEKADIQAWVDKCLKKAADMYKKMLRSV